jgi:hypothetical protein
MKNWTKRLSTLILAIFLAVTCFVANSPANIFAYVLDKPQIQIDQHTQSIMKQQGVNLASVQLYRNYDKQNPYSKDYEDKSTGKHILEVQGLPMVDSIGNACIPQWTQNKDLYNTKNNVFHGAVNKQGRVTLALKNDQPDGKKLNERLTYQPDLYIDGKLIYLGKSSLLAIDPVNENYSENVLEWQFDYGVRRLRLIEGSILGTWIFTSNPKTDVKIVYNQSGDFRLKLGQYATDEDTEVVPASIFDSASYPLEVSDSQTFYPDAHTETATVDGYTGNLVEEGNGVSWATLHDGAGSAHDDSGTNWIAHIVGDSKGSGYWRTLRRSITLYNISLDAGVTITGVVESYRGWMKYNGLPSATPTLNVFASTPASNTDLVNSDFAQVSATVYCDTSITYAGFSTTGYNDFTYNAAGIAAVPKSGVHKSGLREATYDAANNEPPWKADQSYFLGYTAEQGTGYKPKLVVTYSAPVTGWTHISTINGISQADILTIWGINKTNIGTINGITP